MHFRIAAERLRWLPHERVSARLAARRTSDFVWFSSSRRITTKHGYVIQWLRSPIPSNSLASLYGLAKDCAERRVLGDDVDIDIHAFDETNTRIRPERIATLIETAGAGMVMLTGVQSNQFPRALDIARAIARSAGLPSRSGGFHVSGALSMLARRRRRSRPRKGHGPLAVRRRGGRPA